MYGSSRHVIDRDYAQLNAILILIVCQYWRDRLID